MKTIPVNTSTPYSIYIENGSLPKAGTLAAGIWKPGTKALIISDSNVFPLYGKTVLESFQQAGFETGSYLFPAGEEQKTLSTIAAMYAAMAQFGLTRSDFVVALGGGVTGDMAGFAAATFLRGIDFMQIPTTLLAQIDSSVGGKTGADLPQGKNLIGAFHQPRLVLIDPGTLVTLSPRYFADGMAEAIKYGCIKDAGLFRLIAENNLSANSAELEQMIFSCVDIKRSVVERDEFDTGERMLLNFGHTFGHALEKEYHFQKLSHGEAVGIGMVLITRASERNGLTIPGTWSQIHAVLRQYHLPVSDPMPLSRILQATAVDKKGAGKNIRLALLKSIGSSFVHTLPRAALAAFAEGCCDNV